MDAKTWLLDIRERRGSLTPEIVREEARPENSPGHLWVFGLEPKDAAEAHYLEVAHRLIQSVRIRIEPRADEPPRSIRFFYAVPAADNTTVYDPYDVVGADEKKLERVREDANRRLASAESAVADLDALESVATTGEALASVRRARSLIAKE